MRKLMQYKHMDYRDPEGLFIEFVFEMSGHKKSLLAQAFNFLYLCG
jgi:hypothetical protein